MVLCAAFITRAQHDEHASAASLVPPVDVEDQNRSFTVALPVWVGAYDST